jgi:Carboxypeptidase regulatory-like domain
MPSRIQLVIAFVCLLSGMAFAGSFPLTGRVLDPQGVPVANAKVQLVNAGGQDIKEATTDASGLFSLHGIDAGQYQLIAQSPSFVTTNISVPVGAGQSAQVTLQFQQIVSDLQTVSVVATAQSILSPDPGRSVVLHDQVLDANPGRPGAPISIPGLPIETASGGIKAPQYFAPGVAGDHGEPIAQYFQVGDFLVPNNLPANAHGNGYSDPNFMIAPTLQAVTVDGGAFNVRQGNNSVDLAATYIPQPRIPAFLEVAGDYRDGDVLAGWAPKNPQTNAWLAGEFSFGNGFLARPEHRTQYKLNGEREFRLGNHDLTIFGGGYYGFSYIPGLIPIRVSVPDDTIDNRQSDRTHNFLAVITDTWKLSEQRQLVFSGFFRNYALTLRSNFGDGLIQQSEDRNVFGGEAMYVQSVRPWLSVQAGLDLRRDAPRNLDLKHIDDNGAFQPVTSNNLTLSFVEPFFAFDGSATRYIHFNLGVRQEEVWMNNQDLITPQNGFNRLSSLTLPKGTISITPPDRWYLPMLSLSYGESFHTNDPRIGSDGGPVAPTLLAPSRAYQLVLSKTLKNTQFYLTLRRVTNSLELAKIDPDTGLQEAVGPSRNLVLSTSIQRNFSRGSLFISYAQADARDLYTGEPIPEAPRQIWDAVASVNRLPLHLQVRGEFEFVKAKPLGDGFTGVPVTEVRGAVLRTFREGKVSTAANFLIANGYTGQTTETLALPSESEPFERAVGVPLKSYVSLSFSYRFR